MRGLDYARFQDGGLLPHLGLPGKGVELLLHSGIYKTDYMHGRITDQLTDRNVRTCADLKYTDNGPDTNLSIDRRYKLVVIAGDISRAACYAFPGTTRSLCGSRSGRSARRRRGHGLGLHSVPLPAATHHLRSWTRNRNSHPHPHRWWFIIFPSASSTVATPRLAGGPSSASNSPHSRPRRAMERFKTMGTTRRRSSSITGIGSSGRRREDGAMDSGLLLHLCAPATWRMALASGSLAPPSLLSEGLVHLSTPAQVQLPANARFPGRMDLLVLVIDPARLPAELRFEPAPDAPADMRFPHHYGPVPADAVVAAVPYQPESDGCFADPVGLPSPGDFPARVRLFDRALAQRRAAAVLPVNGGIAVLDPRFPASYEHNTLWVEGPSDAATVAAEADRVLGGGALIHRRAVLDDPATAIALASHGWHVQELRLMVYSRPGTAERSTRVVAVTHEIVSRLWERSWRRELPHLDDGAVRQLVDRETVADAVLRVVDLAVLDGCGGPIASAQLRIDGATAAIEAVMTDPAHRQAGLARALVLDAIARARAAGCDVVFRAAAADDWPHHWYTRLGFADVGTRFEATRSTALD
jgi:uncharacterized protein (DUF952 family)/GNAT superfamily N-acetyltransferase